MAKNNFVGRPNIFCKGCVTWDISVNPTVAIIWILNIRIPSLKLILVVRWIKIRFFEENLTVWMLLALKRHYLDFVDIWPKNPSHTPQTSIKLFLSHVLSRFMYLDISLTHDSNLDCQNRISIWIRGLSGFFLSHKYLDNRHIWILNQDTENPDIFI